MLAAGPRLAGSGRNTYHYPVLNYADRRALLGLGIASSCYFLWGLFPLYFRTLIEVNAVEIIAHRAVWTCVTCLGLLALLRRGQRLRRALADRRTVLLLAIAGALVTLNWLTYVYGVNTGRTTDAAIGYFLNPLLTVALARFFLHEPLRPLQWLSLAIATLAVVVLIVAYGSVPWISLGLAFTFGFYSLLKKQAGARVDPLTGLAIETAAVTPLAGGYLLWLAATGVGAFSLPSLVSGTGTLTWLLLAAGPITALPLLLFAEGSRRVSLTVMGLLQYIGPTLQFLVAVFLFHEHLPPARLWAIALVWLAVAVFVTDSLRARRRTPRQS